jgi:hypothetical protein
MRRLPTWAKLSKKNSGGDIMKCANYMNLDAARETVRQHQERYGNPGEPPFYDLSDFNLTKNCSICDFGGTGSPLIDQVIGVLEQDSIKLQETIKRLSGEPLKRVCFKELKEN